MAKRPALMDGERRLSGIVKVIADEHSEVSRKDIPRAFIRLATKAILKRMDAALSKPQHYLIA